MNQGEAVEAHVIVSRSRERSVSALVPAGARVTHVGSTRQTDLFVLNGASTQDMDEFLHRVDTYCARTLARSASSVAFTLELPHGSLVDHIAKVGAAVVWPAFWNRDLERYRVVAEEPAQLERLLDELDPIGDARLEHAAQVAPRAIGLPASLSQLVEGLTERQLQAFRIAVGAGYYETPRKTATSVLAVTMDVTRSTYEEHLRKAERRVFARVADIIDSVPGVAEGATAGRGRPRKQPRAD